jgi:hypothetical protein
MVDIVAGLCRSLTEPEDGEVKKVVFAKRSQTGGAKMRSHQTRLQVVACLANEQQNWVRLGSVAVILNEKRGACAPRN